jgi:hypothetical protein
MAALTGLAKRVAVDNHDPHPIDATVVATTEPALFKFHHGSGGNGGNNIYLVILHGNFKGPNVSPTVRPQYPVGNEIVLEYRARDLSGMGYSIGETNPGLTRLGPSRRLELP